MYRDKAGLRQYGIDILTIRGILLPRYCPEQDGEVDKE
jgi:hypothetical protein